MNDPFVLIDRLIAARPLTQNKVEEITGVRLVPSPRGTNPFYALFVSHSPRGFLRQVELREARKGATRVGGIVILDLDPEAAGVQHETVTARYGKDFTFEPPQPQGPPHPLAYFLYEKPWGELRFGWGLSHGWVETVVIDANTTL